MTVASHILFRLVTTLVVLLGVVAAVAACAGAAHAQQVDESLSPLADLTIASEYNTTFAGAAWDVIVKNNTVGAHPGMQFRLVKVQTTIYDSVRGETKSLWTIRDLKPGDSTTIEVKSLYNVPAATDEPEKVPQRLYTEIIKADPVESPRFGFNNATETWGIENRHGPTATTRFTNGNVVVDVARISNRVPQQGGATTFTVSAYNDDNFNSLSGISGDIQEHTLFEVQVKISLSPGLSFAGTQPNEPPGTTFNRTTGIWNVGTLEFTSVESPLLLPVAVNLTTASLADLPLETRCLTAKVVNAVPWFASDPLKRLDDTATACLGKELLAQGDIALFHYLDCVGVTSTPCTSADTLELLVERSRGDLQPAGVIVHVREPQGRHAGKWRTGKTTHHLAAVPDTQGVGVIFSFLPRSYSAYTFAVSDVSPKQRPGGFSIIGANRGTFTILNADTKKTLGPVNLSASVTNNPYPAILEFGTLGVYKLNLTVGATHNTAGALTDTVTYAFHVGPVADLAVRDAGANPEVAADRRAYTILAVNNGPDDAPAVRVTLTEVPEGAEAVPSQGSYTQGTCESGLCQGVWTIGELRPGYDHRPSAYAGEGAALTLVAASGSPITATIENTQNYCVRIKTANTDPENDLECAAGSVPTGYTEHSIPYYDHVEGNNTTTVALRDGTGVGLTNAPKGVKVMETPAANILIWQPVDKLYGHAVTHYEVQQSASPWMTLDSDVKEAVYLDMTPGSDHPDYRVRAVNEFGVPGPWSESSGRRPGVPQDFSATVAGSGQIDLSWNAPGDVTGVDVTGYEIEVSEDSGSTWTQLAAEHSASPYNHTGLMLSPGAVWQYRVRTVGDFGDKELKSGWATASAEVAYPKPGVPGSFTATGQSATQATLSWSAPDAVTHVNVTGYELDLSTDGGVTWTRLTGTPTLDGTTWTQTHTNSNLAADAVRQYRVRAVGTVGSVRVESEYAYALATENYPAPGAPRDFAATATSDTSVTLSWNAPEPVAGVNLTGYELEVSFDRGVTWTSVATASTLGSGATSHPHTDTANPLSSKPRQYRLKAVGTVGGSTYESGWVFAVPAGEVGPPRNLAATADGRNRIDLTWDPPAFGADLVTGYRIDYTPAAAEDWRTLRHNYRTMPRSDQHTGLLPGDRYCYRVAAVYAGGTGPFAARVCATTEGSPEELPGEPENLRIARMGSNYVTLEWDPPSAGGEVEYYEWRSNIHSPAEVTPRTATSVTVSGLPRSQTYGFQVRAGNSHGPGGWSASIQVTLHRAGSAVKASPAELEVEKGGSGSFNLGLNQAPKWPLMVYFTWDGPDCLTESLLYQQGKILLPTNPPPSKEFWDDFNWGPPEDRWARPWREGLDILVDAKGCQGGETAVVDYHLSTVPFSNLAGLSLWEELDLNEAEWRAKWSVDPLDGISGPSVKVTVEDGGPVGNIGGQQSGPGVGAQPTAVTLALDAARVSESAGQATLTATLDAPAPDGGIGGFLFAGEDGTASEDIDFTMPLEIFIPGGQRYATATISITGDDVDEEDETVVMSALFDIGTALLEDKITLTIADDDTAGVTVTAASPLEVDEGGTASYTVVLDSRPTAAVTVTATSDDVDAAAVSPASHTFTPPAWNTPLTFTVSGVADTDTSDETVGISHGVTSNDAKYAAALLSTVSVSASDTTPEQQQQQGTPNQAPTVASAIADATIVNETGTKQVSLSGVFSDADSDALTVTAASSNTAVATVSVSAGYSSLTVTAKSRGTATITVTADDGNGGTVEDSFTVTVKTGPMVASAISDLSMEAEATQDISLSGVFSDADGDALTITADTSDFEVAEAILFQGTLTVIAVADGTATITVTAQDADGNTVSDSFDVTVVGPPSPVEDLRCIAETGRVAFLWDAPEWSGGETYAYDYELTLPDGWSEGGRLIGITTLRRPGDYQAGGEASISVRVVYQLADESEVYSAAETLTCTVKE